MPNDANEFIQRELMPEILNDVVYPSLQPWIDLFGTTPPKGGDRITTRAKVAYSSNAGSFTKGHADVAAGSGSKVKPYWTKAWFQGASETYNIDVINASHGDEQLNLIGDDIRQESEALMDVVITSLYTQLKKDVDSSSVAYSDASISRSTYASLASYEEETNAAMSIAYADGMINGVTIDKPVALMDYVCLCEQAVYNIWKPLAAALHTWNVNPPVPNQGANYGYQPMENYAGLAIADPGKFHTMTTGDVLMLRKQDIHIVLNLPMMAEQKSVNRFTKYTALYASVNIYADHPGYQGKMTNKD